ncbi:MAG: Ig-like domain-containing protein [Candidatus Bathyarchaeia archaeon]
MKRTCSTTYKKQASPIIFFLTLNLALISISFGQTTQLAVISPTQICVPAEFQVDINITNVVDLYAWQIKLYYNPTVLEWINVTLPSGHFFERKPHTDIYLINSSDFQGTYILCTVSLVGEISGVDGSGTLCQIFFKAKMAGFSKLEFSRPLGAGGDTWLSKSNLLYNIPFTPIESSVNVEGIDAEEPMVFITFPLNGSELRSSTITVRWNGTDKISGIDYYNLRLDYGSWVSLGTKTTYILTKLNDGEHTIEVEAYDKAGNTNRSTVTFTINTSPLFGPGYIEETAIVILVVLLALGLMIYLWKIRKQ